MYRFEGMFIGLSLCVDFQVICISLNYVDWFKVWRIGLKLNASV